MKRLIFVPLALAMALPSGAAFAEDKSNDDDERVSPLEGQPAVRHRKLLVKKRFEFTPLFESTVNADYRHTYSFGAKGEFHLSDMFSIGGLAAYGISSNTGLTNKILDTLPTMSTPGDPTPSQSEFEEHLNKLPVHAAVYAGITPWYGKLAAFGRFYVNFDFYFQGGLAIASRTNQCCSFQVDPTPGESPDGVTPPDRNPNNDDPLNSGLRVGAYLGGGIHVFLSDYLALDLTVRDYIFPDNPSGVDFNADDAVTDDDERVLNHLFVGIGLSIFLPTDVKRTE